MVAPKSTKRKQTAQVLIRCLPEQKEELERRAEAAERELRKAHPGAKLGGVGPWMLWYCLNAEVPGLEKKGKGNGGR